MRKNLVRISLISVIILTLIPSAAHSAKNATPLPGIMAVDLYKNLENREWKCSRPKSARDIADPSKFDKTRTTFDCFSKDRNAYVVAWGSSTSNITWITATATDLKSYGWLGFIATLPITGVDQAAAQKWVLATAKTSKTSKPVVKLFGNIRFQIVGGKTVGRILEISHKNNKSLL